METSQLTRASDTSKGPARGSKKATTAASQHYRIFTADLSDVRFRSSVEAEDADARHQLSCIAWILHKDQPESRVMGYCTMRVLRVNKDNVALFDLRAEYMLGVDFGASVEKKFAEQTFAQVIQTTSWSSFRSLFGIINEQSENHLPKLPLILNSIDFLDEANYVKQHQAE